MRAARRLCAQRRSVQARATLLSRSTAAPSRVHTQRGELRVVHAAARAKGQRAQLQRQAADRQREIQREQLGLQAAEDLARRRVRKQLHVSTLSAGRCIKETLTCRGRVLNMVMPAHPKRQPMQATLSFI